MAGALASLLLLGALSCRESRSLEIAGGPDDLVVLVVASDSAIVESAALVQPGALPDMFGVRPEARLIQFVIAAADLVDDRGRALDRAALGALRVRVGPAPREPEAGEVPCLRCLVPAASPPQQLYPGDSCTLPSFARVVVAGEASGALIGDVRRQIRIERGGVCPCHRHRAASSAAVDYEPISPDRDGWPPAAVAMTPDGTVGLFSDAVAVRVDPTGRRRWRTTSSTTAWCDSAPSELPFVGPVRTAGGLPGRRFLVASHQPGSARDTRFDLFDANFVPHPVMMAQDIQPDRMHYWAPRDRLMVVGEGTPLMPAIFSCDPAIAGGALHCELVSDRQQTGDFDDVAFIVEDLIIGVAVEEGFSYGLAQQDGSFAWAKQTLGRFRFSNGSGSRDVVRLFTVGAVGRRLFACGATPSGAAVVLTSTRTANPISEPPAWTVAAELGAGSCGSITMTSTSPPRGVLTFGVRDAVELTEDGVAGPRRRLGVILDADRDLASASAPVDGWLLIRDPVGGVLRRELGAAGAPDLVYGPPEMDEERIVAIVARADTFWAFGRSGRMRRIEFASQVDITSIQIDGFAPGLTLSTAAPDTASGGFIVSVAGGAQPLLRVSESGAVEVIPIEGLLERTERIIAIAEVASGVHVLAGTLGSLLLLRDAAVTSLEIEWDDPHTPEVESAVTPSHCWTRDLAYGDSTLFTGADGAAGVAWVVGCGGLLLRVRAMIDAPTAERVSINRPDQSLFVPNVHARPVLTAVRALCPDNAIIAARNLNDLDAAKGRVWELAPNVDDRGQPVIDDFEGVLVRDYGPNEGTQASIFGLSLGTPVAVIGASDKISIVRSAGSDTRSSVVRYVADHRLLWSDDLLSAAQLKRGDVLVGGLGNRLVYGRQCD